MKDKAKLWIEKAMEDLRVVEHEMRLSEEEIVTSAVCFHCQQFVEKILKAFLVFKDVDFPRTHNLELLLRLCSEQDSEFKNLIAGNLTYYAVETRYPDEFSVPSIEEAKDCFRIAKDMKQFVLSKFGIDK